MNSHFLGLPHMPAWGGRWMPEAARDFESRTILPLDDRGFKKMRHELLLQELLTCHFCNLSEYYLDFYCGLTSGVSPVSSWKVERIWSAWVMICGVISLLPAPPLNHVTRTR